MIKSFLELKYIRWNILLVIVKFWIFGCWSDHNKQYEDIILSFGHFWWALYVYVLSQFICFPPPHIFVHFWVWMFLSAFVFLRKEIKIMCMKVAYWLDLIIRNNISVSHWQILTENICVDWTPASSSSEPEEPSSLDFFFLASGSFPSGSFPLPSSFFLFSSSPILDLSSGALFLFLSDSAVSLNVREKVC